MTSTTVVGFGDADAFYSSAEVVRRPWLAGVPLEQSDPRQDAIAEAKRSINEEFGRFRLRSGAKLFANEFYADGANDYDICDVRGKFCF